MKGIQTLVALQTLDNQLMELEELLGGLPVKVEQLKTQEAELINNLDTGRERLKTIAVELGKTELNVAQIRTDVAKLKDQLFLVTSNKQYDALMHEIDFLKTTLDQAETTDLELLEEKSTLETQVKEQEQSLASLTEDLAQRREKLEKLIAESSEKKTALVAKRNEQAGHVSEIHLKEYDRVREGRDGIAVIALSGDACGGCGARIPAQIANDIKAGDTIYNCDVCNRFVYWKE